MSELTNLVPNLIEIREEYDEREEETIQAAQVEIRQSEERAEVSEEPEQPMEETRKRKRVTEETSAERTEEKASDWVLERAYVAWRDKL